MPPPAPDTIVITATPTGSNPFLSAIKEPVIAKRKTAIRSYSIGKAN